MDGRKSRAVGKFNRKVIGHDHKQIQGLACSGFLFNEALEIVEVGDGVMASGAQDLVIRDEALPRELV